MVLNCTVHLVNSKESLQLVSEGIVKRERDDNKSKNYILFLYW